MELRQLRYFVRVVELGSMSRAATDLGMVPSALSQQISRLEGELATRLLQRGAQGVSPTEAGLAFFQQAQLALRHAEQAARAAQQARLTGSVSVGLAPTTASVLGLPLLEAMRERYPDVRLHMVESLSGHLSAMLNSRALDLAVLFDTDPARRWSVTPLMTERLYLIESRAHATPDALRSRVASPGRDPVTRLSLTRLRRTPLILPTGPHGLRSTIDAAFARAKVRPQVVAEIDSLALLMEAVGRGLGATIQPWAAIGRVSDGAQRYALSEISDTAARRPSALCSLSDDELSPAALAARVVLADCVRQLVEAGRWRGARLSG
jgi:LysR family tcuABC transcriptional regulator